jgi:preprotein translocase SecE subunit
MASLGEAKGVQRMAGEPSGQSSSVANRARVYFTELQFEWKKITFPSRKELQQSTIVVFVFTMLLMGIISLLDLFIGFFFVNFILPS